MAIRYLLKSQAFSPEDIEIIVGAFEDVLRNLGLIDRDDPMTTVVAKRIIAAAQGGERDPDGLQRAGAEPAPC